MLCDRPRRRSDLEVGTYDSQTVIVAYILEGSSVNTGTSSLPLSKYLPKAGKSIGTLRSCSSEHEVHTLPRNVEGRSSQRWVGT